MNTFKTYMLRKAYENVKKNGDKLAEVETLIDWEAFRPIIQSMYNNKTSLRGRSNIDLVITMKLLVLL